ncbi:hypothetical protein PIROE2DRAFT_12562 [Piromyces sp. E2]|nr:hypothetical protein PIROE2DRAFT_12562 [Piromyces sp. E2]|eukprot:OUM61411.1 hypothetical protein PIROE2DRAFT_12562 [Piromyces sp. E2]
MQYKEFETKLLSYILKDNKKKLLVEKLNNIIVEELKKKFKLVEKVLNHILFTEVFREYRKSDVLIKTYQIMKKDAVEWFLTININPFIQDKNGMTALIQNEKVLNKTNNNGETVLSHALSITNVFKTIINYSYYINYVNHCNNNNDTLLIKCYQKKNDNVNQPDYLGNTALHYATKLRDREAIKLLHYNGANLNIKNNDDVSPLNLAKEIKNLSNKKKTTNEKVEDYVRKKKSNQRL